VTDNASLSVLDLSNLQQASKVIVRGNGALDDAALAPLRMRLGPRNVKIVSNLAGPARLSMCPWTSDGVCDEAVGDCAQGSDASDCSG
jgi:hypothetical protein